MSVATNPSSSANTPWCTSPRYQTWALWFLAALAVFEGYWSVTHRDNDFLWHRHHAEHFLEGKQHGEHYLPARGFMDIALAIAPYRLTRAIVYCLAMVLLLVCCRVWNDLAARSQPASIPVVRGAWILAALLLLPYLMRDLDECGLQIILLFFLTMAGWCVSRAKGLQAGFWLGTAACYKVTPVLFLPFLLWKRQWRAAASMAAFFILWCAAPSLVTGWERNLQAHKDWLTAMQQEKALPYAYPSLPNGWDLNVNNMSLLAGIARYLETYPKIHPLYHEDHPLFFKEHPLYVEHPLFFQFGNLAPRTAKITMFGILGALGLWFAWKTRRPWDRIEDQQSLGLGGEWAAVCVLCALLSPLCWKQHVVLILPCMYLVIRSVISTTGGRGWRMAMIGGCGALMCLFPGPDIFGGNLSAVLHSYKLHTLGCTIIMIWTLCLPQGRTGSAVLALPTRSEPLPRAA
jgi:hypothetical protein